jgi:hypothetical protein
MADTKISALPAVSTPAGTDEFPVNQGGSSKKITLAQVQGYVKPIIKVATATQAIAAADTYVTDSRLLLPASARQQAGMFYRARLILTKTAAGTAAATITFRTGTAGTTGDTSRATLATVGPTAVVDTACLDILATFRAVGASAIISTWLKLDHDLAATGFGNRAMFQSQTTSATFDSTTASLGMGVSIAAGTSSAWTLQACTAEILNLVD